MGKYKQIALRRETYASLQSIGGKGETYDDIVKRLISLWVEKVGDNLSKVRK